MGRPLRVKVPDVLYHITSRTNGKRLFLQKKYDRKFLCKILERFRAKHGVVVYKFMPMGNHFHMVLKLPKEGDLSKFMCEFKTSYAKYYNLRYKTSGHFWGERFYSSIIKEDHHLFACFRYIDQNPIRAGIVRHPRQWDLSSYPIYAYGYSHPFLSITLHPFYLGLASDPPGRQLCYRQCVTGDLEHKVEG
jgi:putative transposase